MIAAAFKATLLLIAIVALIAASIVHIDSHPWLILFAVGALGWVCLFSVFYNPYERS